MLSCELLPLRVETADNNSVQALKSIHTDIKASSYTCGEPICITTMTHTNILSKTLITHISNKVV